MGTYPQVPLQPVLDAVVEELDDAESIGVPVRYLTAPQPTVNLYAVVERPPGGSRTGSLGAPSRDALVRVRLRAVASYPHADQAGRAAEHLLDQLLVLLLDRRGFPLAGPGWEVGARTLIADGGTDVQGTVANAIADVELEVRATAHGS